jgi:phosphate-selective porin
MRYFVSYEFKGFDQDPGKKWGLVDLNIAVPAGKLGAVTIGKTKEPFSYEMVSDAAFLPQIERVLNSFFLSRNVGVVLNNSVLKKRMTYSAGWFNDWWVQGEDFSKWGNHFAGRVTGLVSINEDGSRYFHVGGSARYAGANNGSVRLRGQPESFVTDYYVDTLNISAANQKELAFESLWNRDSRSVLFEYARSWVNAAGAPNPTFYGLYITGSWIITGEHHPYDRNVGFARRIIPRRTWGAVELEARYSRVNLSNKAIDGGLMNIGSFGVNWIPDRRWKIGFATNITSLDRFGMSGLTSKLQGRMQFIY